MSRSQLDIELPEIVELRQVSRSQLDIELPEIVELRQVRGGAVVAVVALSRHLRN